MKARSLILSLLASCAPVLVAADELLRFPDGTSLGFEESVPVAALKMPVGPLADGKIPLTSIEGALERSVWETPGADIKTLDLMIPLRMQLESAGYVVLYECSTRDCGGFDFRFKADVVDEPDMHVDLGDFRYLAATKALGGEKDFVGLLISRSPDRGFVQVTRIGTLPTEHTEGSFSTKQPDAVEVGPVSDSLGDLLKLKGVVALEGLEFLKGSSDLSGNPSDSLAELATFLGANPEMAIVLVGHTDATGSLERNIVLSRKRAESVMQRLVDTYGAKRDQLSAEGVGYLSPRATNTTPEGRDLNRRVEVVLKVSE